MKYKYLKLWFNLFSGPQSEILQNLILVFFRCGRILLWYPITESYTSFSVINKVGNVVIFILFTYRGENK